MRGVIEAMSKKGTAFLINGAWYSVTDVSQLNGAGKDSEVEFEFTANGKWKNVDGKVKVLGESSSSSQSSSTPKAKANLPNHYFVAQGYANLKKQFPVPLDHPDTSILRQNALTNANTLLANSGKSYTPQELIRTAKILEGYSSGNTDKIKEESLEFTPE